MRIAYICQSYPPMISGASLAVQRLAEGIAARDHIVLVMTASEKGEAYTEEFNNLTQFRCGRFGNSSKVAYSCGINYPPGAPLCECLFAERTYSAKHCRDWALVLRQVASTAV